LPRAETAINENLAMIGGDQRAVSRAPAAEHGQAEHGSQDTRVISFCANGNSENDERYRKHIWSRSDYCCRLRLIAALATRSSSRVREMSLAVFSGMASYPARVAPTSKGRKQRVAPLFWDHQQKRALVRL
jgi:hypothetical protein